MYLPIARAPHATTAKAICNKFGPEEIADFNLLLTNVTAPH
jgi:hypothetical protein